MPPLSLSERNPFGLVVTSSSGSSLLETAGSTLNGRKCTRTPPKASKAAPVHWLVASVTTYSYPSDRQRSAPAATSSKVSSFGRSSERAIKKWWLTLPFSYASLNSGYRSERAVSASASWAPNAPYTGSQTDTTVSRNKSSSRNGGSTSKGGIVSLNAAPTTRPCPSRMARDCASVSSLTSMASPELVGSVRAVRRTIQYICVSVSHEPNESVPKGSVWRTSMSPAGGYSGGRRWRACGSRRADPPAVPPA